MTPLSIASAEASSALPPAPAVPPAPLPPLLTVPPVPLPPVALPPAPLLAPVPLAPPVVPPGFVADELHANQRATLGTASQTQERTQLIKARNRDRLAARS